MLIDQNSSHLTQSKESAFTFMKQKTPSQKSDINLKLIDNFQADDFGQVSSNLDEFDQNDVN